MGWLAAQGAIMAIGLFIGLVCSVIGLECPYALLEAALQRGKRKGRMFPCQL